MCKGECENPTEENHSCPYQEDVEGNYDEEYCNCCEECQEQCADNI